MDMVGTALSPETTPSEHPTPKIQRARTQGVPASSVALGMLPPLMKDGGLQANLRATDRRERPTANPSQHHARFREKLTSRQCRRIDQLLDRGFRKLPANYVVLAYGASAAGPAPATTAGAADDTHTHSVAAEGTAGSPVRAVRNAKPLRQRRRSQGAGLAVTYEDYRHLSTADMLRDARYNPFALPALQRSLPTPTRLPSVNVVMRQFQNEKRQERRKLQEQLRRNKPPPPRPKVHDYLISRIAPRDAQDETPTLEVEAKYAVAELLSHYYWTENKRHKRPPTFFSIALAVYFCEREKHRMRKRQICRLFAMLSRDNYGCGEKGIPLPKAQRLHDGFKALDTEKKGHVSVKSFTLAASNALSCSISPTFFQRLDKDRSGDITFSELLRAAFPAASLRATNFVLNELAQTPRSKYGILWEDHFSPEFLLETASLYRHFTKNGDTRLNFKRFKQCAPGDLLEEELAAQFAEADTDLDGRLDFVEFATWIQSTGRDDTLNGSMLPTD